VKIQSIFFSIQSQTKKSNFIQQDINEVEISIVISYQTFNIMKSFIIALVLAVAAIAAPTENEKRGVCTPATYSCTPDSSGWQVCDVTGNWDVSRL